MRVRDVQQRARQAAEAKAAEERRVAEEKAAEQQQVAKERADALAHIRQILAALKAHGNPGAVKIVNYYPPEARRVHGYPKSWRGWIVGSLREHQDAGNGRGATSSTFDCEVAVTEEAEWVRIPPWGQEGRVRSGAPTDLDGTRHSGGGWVEEVDIVEAAAMLREYASMYGVAASSA